MENLEKILVSINDFRAVIKIGWTGENQARGIIWDISKWQEIYGNGTCTLLNQRGQDTTPYPCFVNIENNFAIWKITEADIGNGGNGKCQLIYTVGDKTVAKTPVYKTFADRSLGNETEPPESASDWVLQVLQAGQDAVDAAERAEESAESAEESAKAAEGSVTNASHIDFEVRDDGHVWLIKAGAVPGGIDFKLKSGRLVAIYGND